MGNKQNKIRRKKRRSGQLLKEWKVLHSFGLVKSQAEKAKSALSCPPSEENVGSPVEHHHSFIDEEFQPVQPITAEEPTTPLQEQPALVGRRIVDVGYFISEIKNMSNHGEKFGCSIQNMIFQKEITQGLRCGFEFKCNMCRTSQIIWSENESSNKMNINEAAVAAVMSTGGGYTMLSQLLAGIDVHCMSSKTYDRIHKKVAVGWEETALEEMKAAAAEEARLARERGDVDNYGVPLLTVVTDASWAKRSYRNNYNSLSGVVSISYYNNVKYLVAAILRA
jgi:hypothetical protein